MKKFRENGAVGAILDEYEKAILALNVILEDVSHEELVAIVDQKTDDPDCRSIQTVLTHVVGSGYTYAIEVRRFNNEAVDYIEKEALGSIEAYQKALLEMFAYNEKLFMDYDNLVLEEFDVMRKIKVRWGQFYDVEQLFEHAIVHILRHRRQIEKFLLQLRGEG